MAVILLHRSVVQGFGLDHRVLIALLAAAHHQGEEEQPDRHCDQREQGQPPVDLHHVAEDHEGDDQVGCDLRDHVGQRGLNGIHPLHDDVLVGA